MDMVAIEGRTFGEMKQRFEAFIKQVQTLCGDRDKREKEKWLTNNDICQFLHISLRTLQSYRDNGTLPYSQIGRKCYYKASDIESLISQSQIEK